MKLLLFFADLASRLSPWFRDRMQARWFAAGLGAAAVFALPLPASAFGGSPGSTSVDDAGAVNVDALLAQLTRDVESLSVADCALSCKALASMERARDRICELSPGARCDEARTKVASARDRVSAACPTCTTHERPEPAPPNDAKASAPPPAHAADGAEVRSEHERGGCASCRVTGERGARGGALGDAGLVMLAAFALRRIARRRRAR